VRIGIDATWAAVKGSGTASYTNGLTRALVAHPEHDLVLYFRPGDELTNPLFSLRNPNVSRRVVPGIGQLGRTWLSLPRQIARDRLDVFHSPAYFLPPSTTPGVVTFHDLNMFLQADKWWRPGMRAGWASLCVQSILASRLARAIVSDSGFAAAQIHSVLHVAQRRIHVVYPGVEDIYFHEDEEDAVQHPDSASGRRFLLYVGVLSPQKNLEGIVRAFAKLSGIDIDLVIVGRRDGPYFDDEIRPLIGSLGVEGRVKVLGTVEDAELRSLYRRASALVWPSFAEGFGLPPLEAMACGTPVVASNRTSLPEVLDGAALLLDPSDLTAISEAINRVLTDKQLADDLRRRGRERASQFRWSATVQKMLDVYASVA